MTYLTKSEVSAKFAKQQNMHHPEAKLVDFERIHLETQHSLITVKFPSISRFSRLKETEAIDKEFNMTSSSDAVKIQDVPFNKDFQPLDIRDSLVQKFQKTMKQHPPGTAIDIFRQNPNDRRCQDMWNGCKKLRQFCISSTQYDACAAYVHAIGTNVPITSPPDDACIALRQPDQLNRI